MRVMPFLFELVYSGENAFHITVADFYTIDFTNAPDIQSILGFELKCWRGELTIHDIIPEYLMQPEGCDEQHHVSRAIDAYWILYAFGVHRYSE